MKLLHKLLLLVMTLSIIPLGIVGFQAMSGLQSEIDQDIQSIFKEKVSANSKLISDYMNNVTNKIKESVAFNELAKIKSHEKDSDRRARVNRFAEDVVSQFNEIRMVTILDEIGEEMTSAYSHDQVSPVAIYNHSQSIIQQMAQVLKSNKAFSPVYFNGESPTITFFYRINFEDRPAPGFLAVAIDLIQVKSLIEEIGFSKSISGGTVLLFDQEKNLIAGKKEGSNLKKLNDYKKNDYFKEAWLNYKTGLSSKSGEYTDPYDVVQMTAFNFLDHLDWLLFIAEPKDDVFASAKWLLIKTIGIILITIIASIFAGLTMSKMLVKPIHALVKGSQEIGAGNLEYKIDRLSNDEIGELCDSFSQMGSNLKHREDTITQIRVIASELNSTFEKKKVIEVGTKAIQDLTGCLDTHVFLHEGEDLKDFYQIESSNTLDRSEHLLKKMSENNATELVEKKDLWRDKNQTTLDMKTLLVPLNKNDPKEGLISKGSLVLGNTDFTSLDQQVSQILAGAMTVSLMNIEYLQSSVANERRQHELELAELVQKTLYPESDPEIEQLEIASYLLSSSETGGDWYGFIESENGKTLSVLIGDVTGHGAPAALVTAATNAFFATVENMARANVDIDIHDPVFLLKLLNKVILETAHGRLVMTFFISTIDLETGMMTYANAGHNSPWIWRVDPNANHDPPVHISTDRLKSSGGKVKLKMGSKKEQSKEETDRKKVRIKIKGKIQESQKTHREQKKIDRLKVSMGEKILKEGPANDMEAPEKKIKIKMKGKVSDAVESPQSKKKLQRLRVTMGDKVLRPGLEKSEKKLKIKIGQKKDDPSSTKIKIKTSKKSKVRHWENINTRGMRLGESLDVDYSPKSTMLHQGDVICWYTDGWIENTNEQNEEFGKKRMQRILEENIQDSMRENIEVLKSASWDFYGNQPREDDLTIVLSRVNAAWGPKKS